MSDLPALSQSARAIGASVFADLAPHIEAHMRRGGDLIELHIGDTHVPPPEGARFSSTDPADGFDGSLYRYGAVSGLPALKQAFAAYLTTRGIGPRSIDPGRHILVACGATHAIFCAARAVLDPGDEVLVAAPYWPLSVGILRAAGAVVVEVPLTNRLSADPSLDPAAVLEEALTPATRAIYVTTPNNPDGKVLTEHHLARIAALAVRRGLWVIADEVYADYVYDGSHASIARHEGMVERTISAYSLSKSHALAGARIGFGVAPERVIDVARRVSTHTVFNVPVAAQRVALAALAAPPEWIIATRGAYREARDAAMRALDGSGASAFVPDGGCFVFIDFRPWLGPRPLRVLLERAIDKGVLLAPGRAFGGAFSTWVRLCFTSVTRARLIEGIARLRDAMSELGA